MATGAKVILLPVVSLLGVPAEMLMFPTDSRLLVGSPGALSHSCCGSLCSHRGNAHFR